MNAYELANKLEQGHWESGTREQAATMLRQQQAEIEALKYEKSSGAYQGKYLEQYWVTQQSDEPVAWMAEIIRKDGVDDSELSFTKDFAESIARPTGAKVIPLYTHPAKTLTLTPDEIFDIWDEHTDYDGNFISDIDTFVLAILRKAQEK